MKISVDLDGILCDFCARVTQIANSLWPGKIPVGYEPGDWEWSDVLSRQDWDAIWQEIYATPNFWESCPTYPENVHALRTFLHDESDHEIYYVTSRRPTCGRPVTIQCENWLVQNGIWPQENYHAVLVVDHASVKRFVMADLGIQVSIDDMGSTVRECNDVNNHKAYLLDAPYNRSENYGTRVFSLQQFFKMVTGKMPADYFLV